MFGRFGAGGSHLTRLACHGRPLPTVSGGCRPVATSSKPRQLGRGLWDSSFRLAAARDTSLSTPAPAGWASGEPQAYEKGLALSTATLESRKQASSNQSIGVFPGAWESDESAVGAPHLRLDLMFNAPHHSVAGHGQVTQATNPPLDVESQLTGDYTYMTVMPQNTHVLVVVSGTDIEVRMVLDSNWESGTVTYRYRTQDGAWHTIESVPVKAVPLAARAGQQ